MTEGDGVLFVSLGSSRRQWLFNAIASVQRHCPGLPVHVVCDVPVDVPFTWVRCPPRPRHGSRYYKTQMHRLSPFAGLTLYLDDDTVVHKPLPPLAEMLGGCDLAMAQEHQCRTTGHLCRPDNRWNGWTLAVERDATAAVCRPDFPHYNDGVVVFDRSPAATALLDRWHAEWLRFEHVDQLAMCRAMVASRARVNRLDARQYNCRTDWFDRHKASPSIFHFSRKEHEKWYHPHLAPMANPHAAYRAFCRAVSKGICVRGQYEAVGKLVCLKRSCNMLVWGCGADSDLWRVLNAGGRTLFIENDPRWAAKSRAHGCEVLDYSYPSVKGEPVPDIPLPGPVGETAWDLVLIDGPPGSKPQQPGRELPIRWTSRLIDKTGQRPIIALHDHERPWERHCADRYLGRPDWIVGGRGEMAFWNLTPAALDAILR